MDIQPNNKKQPKPVDAFIKVTVTTDMLKAHLSIDPPKYNGSEATPRMIDDALNQAKVTFGIDMQLLIKLKSKPVYSRDFIIAKGLAPQRGVDGAIKYLFEVNKEAHPKLRDDGSVDYRDLGFVTNVKNGQVLAEIKLPTYGVDGMAVTGKKLVPVPGRAVPSPVGRNTALSEDGTKLLSTVDGHVSLNGDRVNVVDTFIVQGDVDTSTGNIKSICSVTVVGSVSEGYSVEAAGNIDIGGNVEGGFIKADGNVAIHGGVIGRGCGKIECKGNLSSTFFENCEANVGGDVKTETIMNSNIKCVGKLVLSGIRAKLMGGRFIVGDSIVASSIGSPSGINTEITLGADPKTMTRYAALAAEKKQLAEQIEKLGQIIKLLDQYDKMGNLPMSKQRMLKNSRLSLQESTAKLASDTEEYDAMSGLIQNSGNGKIICRGTMYRGVKLTIGIASMVVENDISTSEFSLDGDKIAVKTTSSY